MKKKILIGLFAVLMCFTLVGCGNKEEGTGGNNTDNGVAWPSNEYTNLIPKPEGATIYEEKAIDNYYFVGHSIDLTDWTIEECKAYAEKLKAAGFTTPGEGMNDVVVKNTDSEYSFGAENSDGVYVTVGSYSGNNSGRISIQVTK